MWRVTPSASVAHDFRIKGSACVFKNMSLSSDRDPIGLAGDIACDLRRLSSFTSELWHGSACSMEFLKRARNIADCPFLAVCSGLVVAYLGASVMKNRKRKCNF